MASDMSDMAGTGPAPATAGPTGFVDETRAVLVMTGADARDVLQGVVSNDVTGLAEGRAVYAALLTPQGKYLADFILADAGQGRILIDAAADQAGDLARRLSMYSLRRDAQVAETPLKVALVWGGRPESPNAVPDPRIAALGWRVYGADPAAMLAGVAPGDRAAYDALRVAHAVPASGVELVPNDTFILEAGFERLHGVDFRKGCYVGQEVTARMKHKTALRKGLVRVRVAGHAAPGTEIAAGGKPAGRLFTVAGGQGLAHLRFDRAGQGMQAGAARVDYAADEALPDGAPPGGGGTAG